MVLTPRFKVQQDHENLTIEINVPYIKVTNAEVLIEGQEFSFFCSPYLLKLTLPREVCDEEGSYHAKYDPNIEHGQLSVKIKKKNVGEFFPDLDLLSTLMQTKKIGQLVEKMDLEGNIEVLHSENFVDEEHESEEIVSDVSNPLLTRRYMYGFNNSYSNVLQHLSEAMHDMLEISSPETLHPITRRQRRIHRENELFDAYRYLGDLNGAEEDPLYSQFLNFTPFWNQQWNHLSQLEKQNSEASDKWTLRLKSFDLIGGFDEKEEEILANRLSGNKKELLAPTSHERTALLYGLLDILFSLCYDYRLTTGEYSPESCYNVTRLSATLSWLESYTESNLLPQRPKDDLSDFKHLEIIFLFNFRRLLIYPYLRHWKLGRKVLTDITKLFLLGKRPILKLLLQLYSIYEHTDTHYLLNNIYIRDYCLWLQHPSVSDEDLFNFGVLINEAKTAFERDEKASKHKIGLNLNEIEAWARSKGSESESEDSDDAEEEEEEEEETFEQSEPLLPSELMNFSESISSDECFNYLRPEVPQLYDSITTSSLPRLITIDSPIINPQSASIEKDVISTKAEVGLLKEVKTVRKSRNLTPSSLISEMEDLSLQKDKRTNLDEVDNELKST